MSALSRIGEFFRMIGKGIKSVAVFVCDAFIRLFGKDASEQFADSSLKLLRSEAGKLVLGAVAEVEKMAAASGLTNQQKREQALVMAEMALKEAGISVGESILNLLLELAVQAVKRNFAIA